MVLNCCNLIFKTEYLNKIKLTDNKINELLILASAFNENHLIIGGNNLITILSMKNLKKSKFFEDICVNKIRKLIKFLFFITLFN